MSGSKDKQRRRSQRDQGFDFRNPKDIEAEKKRRKQTRSAVTVLVIFAVLAVFLLITNSNQFYRSMTALRVEDHRFSIAEMNFFFSQARHQLSQEQQQMFIEGMEEELPTDLINERAIEMAQAQAVLHRRAVAEGLTISEEAREEINESMQFFRENHAIQGFSTANGFVMAHFGMGVNMRLLESLLEFEALGRMYTEQVLDSLRAGYTEEELETFYVENRDDYDRILYHVHSVLFAAEGDSEEEGAEEAETPDALTEEEAQEQADAIAAAARTGGEAGFVEAARDSLDEATLAIVGDDFTLQAALRGTLVGHLQGDWLLDDARRAGDVTVMRDENMFHVLYFLEVDDNDYYSTNVRHILIMPERIETEDEQGEPLDIDPDELAEMEEAASAEALAKAEEVLAEWQSGAATEESFIELVREHSDDFNPEFQPDADPGLFSDITRNSPFVAPFEDWAMDPSRRVGDVGIVETQFGYHIMYFVGFNDELTLRHLLAREAMLARDHEIWQEGLMEEMLPAQSTFFFRFVG